MCQENIVASAGTTAVRPAKVNQSPTRFIKTSGETDPMRSNPDLYAVDQSGIDENIRNVTFSANNTAPGYEQPSSKA